MPYQIQIDDRQFRQAVAEYKSATGKDLVYILNRAGRNLAFKSLQQTHKADKAEIEQLRQQVATQVFSKTGKRLNRPKRIYSPTTEAQKILLSRLWKSGQNPRKIFGSADEINQAALKMINARIRAAGFIASGWLPAAKAFSAATGLGVGSDGVKQYGRSKGYGAIAQDGDNPTA